jgi:hypothetical protein
MPKLSPYFTVSSLTKTLFVFTAVTGLATAIAVGDVRLDAEKIEYSAEPMNQACEAPSDDRTEADSNDTQVPDHREYPRRVLAYRELSPEAQAVFRSALEADGEYTTRTHPDEFELQTDTPNPNHIQYESDCYRLTAQTGGGVGTGFAVIGLLAVGGGITVIFAFACVFSYERDRRRNGGLCQPESNSDTEPENGPKSTPSLVTRVKQSTEWRQTDSSGPSEHKNCPDCDMTLVMGVDECQRCGWSSTDDDMQDADSSQFK